VTLHRRLPIGRLAAVAALAAGAYVLAQQGGMSRWRTLSPGVEFTLLRGGSYCRRGSPDVAVLRLDPARVRFGVHHYTQRPEGRPLSVVEWMRATHGLAVFNAGQYYPDYSYMGLLVSDGQALSPRPHPEFRGALVAEPVGGGAGAHVLDLRPDSLKMVAQAWREVAQSLMLFDRDGRLRVRRSDSDANRTVVAEDRLGRLLVFTSEGAYTLYDFSRWLKETRLGLVHAMSMDGGLEAEMCVHDGRFAYASFGHWNPRGNTPPAEGGRVPLPAVISVSAR
jgi:uncharacterized protein YigE (DUF2233 family)